MAVIYRRALFAILEIFGILVQVERISERINLRLRYIEIEIFDGSRCRLGGGEQLNE